MSIERKTVVDQIEITRGNVVQVRIGLLLVEDGKEIDCRWHRTVIDEDTDVDSTFELVNVHLTNMGCKPVEAADIDRIKQFVDFTASVKA